MQAPAAPSGNARILVALATFNRPYITDLCLRSLSALRGPLLRLVIFDDASTAYDAAYLSAFADQVIRFDANAGIQSSRLRSLRDFVELHHDCDLLYLTDNDTLHDPAAPGVLRQLYAAQSSFPRRMPFGLFNSLAHARPDNTLIDQGPLQVRRTGPGVSQCYDREMATTLLHTLESGDRTWTASLGEQASSLAFESGAWRFVSGPHTGSRISFDYLWPMILGRGFLQTKLSYLEHFARDRREHGLHAQQSLDPRQDFEIDCALNPTPYLTRLRPATIDYLLGLSTTPPDLQVQP